MKKLYEKESQLLQRKRIAFEILHEKKPTPKRDEIKKQIASELKLDENLISIRHIFTNYGKNKSKIIVHIYKDNETFKKLEKKKVRKDGKNKESTQERKEEKKEQKT